MERDYENRRNLLAEHRDLEDKELVAKYKEKRDEVAEEKERREKIEKQRITKVL